MVIRNSLMKSVLLLLIFLGGLATLWLHKNSEKQHLELRKNLIHALAGHLILDLRELSLQGADLTGFLEHVQNDLPEDGAIIVRDANTGDPLLVSIGEHFDPAKDPHARWQKLLERNPATTDHGEMVVEDWEIYWHSAVVPQSPWKVTIYITTSTETTLEKFTEWMLLAMIVVGLAIVGWRSVYSALRAFLHVPESLEKPLHTPANLDPLTGLPNRGQFTDTLQRTIEDDPGRQHPFALCMLGINHFKRFNDSLGHYGGDELLREFARRLQGSIRHNDIVARVGGDEFAILLRDVNESGARSATEKISAIVDENITVDDQDCLVAASFGIALYPTHGNNVQTLLHQADAAMHAAKTEGNKIVVYESAHDAHTKDVISLASDLRAAIKDNQIELHYQPKYDLDLRHICGAEALLRWKHPTRGAISPMDFIEIAEQSGLIKPLTCWVIDRAFADYSSFSKIIPDFKVSINLSVANLHDPKLVGEIATLAKKHDIQPSSFIFEITESAVMINVNQVSTALRALHLFGFKISVDDFGTGYTSFLNLKHMPIGEIKIDRSFVRNLTLRRDDASIVQATIDLGKALGISVVAEGVESREILHTLRDFGCDVAQGYFISKPVPLSDLTQWLTLQNTQPDSIER